MPYNPVTGASPSTAPYSAKAISGNPVRNNGGTVMMGGNVQTSYSVTAPVPVTNALGTGYLGYNSGLHGSRVPLNPSGDGVSKALSSGTFAKMVAGVYIGIGYSNMEIAGTANSMFRGGAGYAGRRAENSYVGFVRTEAYIMTGGWNYTTGSPINRQTRTDVIANETLPTRAIPGKLTYMIKGTAATVDSYKAITS